MNLSAVSAAAARVSELFAAAPQSSDSSSFSGVAKVEIDDWCGTVPHIFKFPPPPPPPLGDLASVQLAKPSLALDDWCGTVPRKFPFPPPPAPWTDIAAQLPFAR